MEIEGLSAAAAAIALLGGLVSFLSPCVLPLVPVYIGHLSGVSVRDGTIVGGRVTFLHACAFVLGFSVVFVALGATIGLLGGFAGGHQVAVSRIAGLFLIAMGVYMTGAFRLPGVRRVMAPVTERIDPIYNRERRYQGSLGSHPGYWRSLATGGAFAVGWVPCITPVLGAILTLAYSGAASASHAWSAASQAAVLLAFYAAGLSLPFLATGLLMGKATAVFRRLDRFMPAINICSGLLIIGVGVLVFLNCVTQLNQYFNFLPYVSF